MASTGSAREWWGHIGWRTKSLRETSLLVTTLTTCVAMPDALTQGISKPCHPKKIDAVQHQRVPTPLNVNGGTPETQGIRTKTVTKESVRSATKFM